MVKSISEALADAVTLPANEEERSRSRGRSSDPKKTEKKQKTSDGEINEGQMAMVDVLMTRMTKLMSDTLAENNSQTQRQISHISSQLHAVATTTDANINNLQNQQSTMKEQLQRLGKTIETQQQTQSAQGTTTKRHQRQRQ